MKTAFSTVLLLGLAVIFASFKLMKKKNHVYIVLILIDLCTEYKRGGRGKGFWKQGRYRVLSKAH